MKAFVVINVARQINGEFIFVKVEKAFKDLKKAEDHLASLKFLKEKIKTNNGFEIECSCERGIFSIDIED